jgi:hypothetical protein
MYRVKIVKGSVLKIITVGEKYVKTCHVSIKSKKIKLHQYASINHTLALMHLLVL